MKKILPLFLLAVSAFGEPVAGEKVELLVKFKPGKTYVYSQDINGEMEMKSPLGEGTMKVTSDMGMNFSYIAEEHEKGVKVDMKVNSMNMKSGTGGMTLIDFDSTKEVAEGDPFATAFKPILEMNCYSIYDNEGKPIEFGGLEEMAGAEQMGFDSEMFEQMFKSSYEMMPKTPVGVGDTWKSEQELPMGKMADSLTLIIENTLESFEEKEGQKIAVISFTANMDMTIDTEEEGSSPMSIKTKSFTGKIWHNIDEQMTVKSTTSAELVMSPPAGVEVEENGLGEIPYKMEVVQLLEEIK